MDLGKNPSIKALTDVIKREIIGQNPLLHGSSIRSIITRSIV
jgi:hypothetical protein